MPSLALIVFTTWCLFWTITTSGMIDVPLFIFGVILYILSRVEKMICYNNILYDTLCWLNLFLILVLLISNSGMKFIHLIYGIIVAIIIHRKRDQWKKIF